MKVLRRDDVGRGHGPVGGHLDVLLLEDQLALEVLDDGVTELPRDFIEGRDAGAGEMTLELQAVCTGGMRSVGRSHLRRLRRRPSALLGIWGTQFSGSVGVQYVSHRPMNHDRKRDDRNVFREIRGAGW